MSFKHVPGVCAAAIFAAATLTTPALTAQTQQVRTAPAVLVEYLQPEKFSDVGSTYLGGDASRTAYLDELRKHLVRRAAPLVAEGQQLTITITDVDMAGDFEPWRSALRDVRIVKDIYPPRIDLRFKLSAADGGVAKEGERKLRDPAFQLTARGYHNDPLRYEKALLDDWLKRELAPRNG